MTYSFQCVRIATAWDCPKRSLKLNLRPPKRGKGEIMNSNDTTAQKARIKSAFEKLDVGDVLEGEDHSFLVIRHVDGRAIVGIICSCKKRHVVKVFDDTYAWSDGAEAVVGSDGKPAEWWSPDLEVNREVALDIATKSAHLPVSADYRVFSSDEKDVLVEQNKELLHKCVETLTISDSKTASFRRVLEQFGVHLTDEKAELLFVAINEAGRVEEQAHEVKSLIGSLLVEMMLSRVSRKEPTH